MSAIASIAKFGIVAYALSALIPLSKSDAWWVRAWDFPRLQFLVIGFGFGAAYLLTSQERRLVKVGCMTFLAIGSGFDLYRVLPYSAGWTLESLPSRSEHPSRRLSLITANVLQGNNNSRELLSIIDQKDPDLILLLEVNGRWLKDLASLDDEYTFNLKQPQDNEYGLALYSKLPLEGSEIRFLVEPEIPSVHTKVTLPSGDQVEVIGLHPRPPRQQAGPTTERDAELVQVAKTVRGATTPVIVMGDLNDVAWSHTTRLFRRISGLLDPRVGRAPFPTFPVSLPFFRFPLDHVFHSESFTLRTVQRLGDIGSDHFPMYVSLQLEPSMRDEQNGPAIDAGDINEADDTIDRAKDGGAE